MHTLRTAGELLVDVALAVGDHGDASCAAQHLRGFLRSQKPAIGFLVLERPWPGIFHFDRGAVEYLRADQPDHAAIGRVDGDGWMQKQTKIAVIAGTPEAALAGGVAGEVEFRRILNRQHVPPDCTLAGETPSGSQHLAMADRGMVKEAAKGKRLVAISRQGMNTGRGLFTHRLQQTCADTTQTRITKATKIFLNHTTRPPRRSGPRNHGSSRRQSRFALVRPP